MESETIEDRSSEELVAPYITAIRPEAKSKISGHERSIDIIFDEINRQAVESFQINSSEKFPGVRFSSVHLSVTPELIRRINPQINTEESKTTESQEVQKVNEPKHYVFFLQPAFGKYPGGNAYSVLDLGIDRFIREIPKVASRLKRGEKPPKIDIYLVGSPHSFGGNVTLEWVDQIKREGFEPHGKLYAEFMENHLPKDPDELARTRIIMQGVSEGSATSTATSKNLSEVLRDKTQRLYDIPAGNHERKLPSQILRSANLLGGTAAEMAVRMIGGKIGADVTSASLFQTEPQFYKDIARKFDVPEDDEQQSKLKTSCLLPEVLALMKGTPFDKSERTFVRKPEFDPINLDVGNLGRILANDLRLFWRKKFIASQNGKVFNAPTSRKLHFFAHKKSFKAWGRVMEYAESNPKQPLNLPQTS